EFPHDLKELGCVWLSLPHSFLHPMIQEEETLTCGWPHFISFFINEKDQLRQIEKPDEGFDYFAHGRHHGYMYAANGGHGVPRERLNERRRDAVDCTYHPRMTK